MKKISTDTALLVIDVQERFVPVIDGVEMMTLNIKKCIKAAKLFDMRVSYSEQYPKGLGRTVPTLLNELDGAQYFEKATFSCFGEADFCEYIEEENISSLLIVGIETHVCVFQTALDALERGIEVFVALDAVASRQALDKNCALKNLETQGAVLSTFECLFMQLVKSSQHKKFRDLSSILKLNVDAG